MITLKKWNSFTDETRKKVLDLIWGGSGYYSLDLTKEYHHSFDYDSTGKQLKKTLESCYLQKDGSLRVDVVLGKSELKYAPPKTKTKTKKVATKPLVIPKADEFLFKRYKKDKKLEMINALSEDRLLDISEATIIRIVKEAGTGSKGSRNKTLRIASKNKKGNDWNSVVDGIYYHGQSKTLCLDLTVYSDDCDNTWSEYYKDFFQNKYKDFTVHYPDKDRYGHPYTIHATYDKSNKAEVIRSILIQYVENK